ncbi:unnamed protein product [Caenorhabditis sp. 36 PRJEB53466]|nr:unnamed protein product [Caenorhabditis sp. 36 PRJEB53466]
MKMLLIVNPFNFPWLENVPKLEFTTSKPNFLIEEMKKGRIPRQLMPFVNLTAVEELKKVHNDTLDFIIRDEDVADMPDDDGLSDESRRVNTLSHDGNKSIITISDEARDDLYKHWMDQSLAGLMGAVVTEVINKRKMSKAEKKEHYTCIHASKNVTAHAKCVVIVLDQLKRRNEKLKVYSTLSAKLNAHRKQNRTLSALYKSSLLNQYDKYVKSGGEELRVKRQTRGFTIFDEMENKRQAAIREHVTARKSYTIREQKSLSPLAVIARKLTELVRAAKNTREPPKRWQQVIQEIKDESSRIKGKRRNKERMKRKFSKFVTAMKETGLNAKSALQSIGMDDLFADEPILSEKEQDERDVEEMMATMSPEDKIMNEPIKLIREGTIFRIHQNRNDGDGQQKGAAGIDKKKKIALLSPQFMSILPDEVANDTLSLLSPSILSLHGEGSMLDREISLTKALNLMESTGQEEWMNFVLEASGVTETVDRMRKTEMEEEEEERKRDFVDKKGQPMYFSKKIIYKSMDDRQMESMNKTGYAIMDDAQLMMLYGPGSPYNDSETLDKFRGISPESMPERIQENIRMIAREEMKFEISRKKDLVLTPTILTSFIGAPAAASQSIILSPLVFAPLVLSPSIYGNVILSPWVFVPVIVSPRVLGAVVLSPIVFSPVILSPLCLVPVILSPGVGLPLILSPFVLSPFILSPVALSPLILSPFCLSPFIGVPNLLTPIILSPFVLSPLILSPPFISAFVLNPYALSPAILSNGAVFTAVLSPSWLSTL